MNYEDKWFLLTRCRIAKLRSYREDAGFWARPIVGNGLKNQGYIKEGDVLEEINQEIAELLYG